MAKTILVPILLIAVTDVALQLDNALAISSVAAGVPAQQRFLVLAVGVLLAACCLFFSPSSVPTWWNAWRGLSLSRA
jgi:predicted tellurium resistance membrane protein TerC